MCLDSTIFCVRTTRQVSLHCFGNEMNWILSFLVESDKLVIGEHLFLSPVSTAVETAYSEFDRRPNPIQEGCRNALRGVISRCHARLVEEYSA